MEKAIGDYGVLGDCRGAALVSRGGSIDWLCWPRFDSPPLLGALLDERCGRWTLGPAVPARSSRSYSPDTNVLRTLHETDEGALLVTDFMPARDERETRRELLPEHELLRLVECVSGRFELETAFEPRPDFGRGRVRGCRGAGARFETAQGLVMLRSDVPLSGDCESARGRVVLRAGERRCFSLTMSIEAPAIIPPLEGRPWVELERTEAWWRSWAARLRYDGPLRGAVVRSALALRLMIYAPSGAIVAAPTTSLPEIPGGPKNWDYRFCWLRDASMTVRAFLGLGCLEEAEAFVSWLLHSTRLTRPELRVLYDVFGRQPAPESEVKGLRGWADSRPVRVGNAAASQLQLDVYGEVAAAAANVILRTRRIDGDTRRLLEGLAGYVLKHWSEPDEGIWEPRSGRAHRTHSRVLCWTALDRVLELHEEGLMSCRDAPLLAAARSAIRRDVEQWAWSPALRAYTSVLGGTQADAAVLLMSWHGFSPAECDRMKGTYRFVRERLDAGDGLLYRNEDKKRQGEGAFGICGFWAADFLALGGGPPEDAEALLRTLAGHANDLGLFGEELQPGTLAALGNFPQAFTHIGLINAALSLQKRAAKRRPAARA